MQKEVKLELVAYNTEHIAEATVALIHNFAKYSGIFGTEQWVGAIVYLLEIIKQQQARVHTLSAEGVEVSFSGFPNPRPTIEDGQIIFVSLEPRFTITDRLEDILPRQRIRTARVALEIATEMKDVYHLRTEYYPPLSLVFPKQEFAKERVIFAAKLL